MQLMIENCFNALHQWMGKETPSQASAGFLSVMVAMALRKGVVDYPEFVQQECTSMIIFGRCDDNTARCKMETSLVHRQ